MGEEVGVRAGDALGARTLYGAADAQAASESHHSTTTRQPPEAGHQAVGRGMSD